MVDTTTIKITVPNSELNDIDRAVEKGVGSTRADVCRKAIILYMKDLKKSEA